MYPAEYFAKELEAFGEAFVGAVQGAQEFGFFEVGNADAVDFDAVGQAVELKAFAVGVTVQAENVDAVGEVLVWACVKDYDVTVFYASSQH